jgi:hypothetical protein
MIRWSGYEAEHPNGEDRMSRKEIIRGIVHCHSEHSFDARMSYAELREYFLGKGLSFACMTEHIEYLDQEKIDAILAGCEEHSDDEFLFVPGIEMDYFKIYFLGVRPTRVDFSDHRSIFDSLHPNAELCILSHPIKARYRYPQWLIDLCDGVEVLNTKHDGRHYLRPQSERLLAQVRKYRPHAVGVAGMDFHSPKQYSGAHLALRESVPLTREAVLGAIRSGAFDIWMNGRKLSDVGAVERNWLRMRIHAMDIAHRVNKAMADAGFRVPGPIRKLLRKGMEGA